MIKIVGNKVFLLYFLLLGCNASDNDLKLDKGISGKTQSTEQVITLNDLADEDGMIGASDFTTSIPSDIYRPAWEATGLVIVFENKLIKGSSTALLVQKEGKVFILTAKHTFYDYSTGDLKGNSAYIVFPHKVSRVAVDLSTLPLRLSESEMQDDYIFVPVLESESTTPVKPFNFKALDHKEMLNDAYEAYSTSVVFRQRKLLRLFQKGGQIDQIIGSKLLKTDMDAIHGSSGSPVIIITEGNVHYIVGILTNRTKLGRCYDYGRGLCFNIITALSSN